MSGFLVNFDINKRFLVVLHRYSALDIAFSDKESLKFELIYQEIEEEVAPALYCKIEFSTASVKFSDYL